MNYDSKTAAICPQREEKFIKQAAEQRKKGSLASFCLRSLIPRCGLDIRRKVWLEMFSNHGPEFFTVARFLASSGLLASVLGSVDSKNACHLGGH